MAPNYGEIICNAVDEIVTAKLQGLQYDITKLCTIVDDSMNYQGKYIISDGTARYEAYSNDVSLKSGNQVQVSIPNGDYTMQKTIIGRIATTDTTPFNYIPPLDTMIKITNNVFDNAKTLYSNNNGLLANGDKLLLGPIYSLEGADNLAGYTRLGLSAEFCSWLRGLDVASGSYGIKVLIYTDAVQIIGEEPENMVYELTFSSADMIGNPYQFEDYFYQEKVFDISNISNIKKIEVYFYQDSNFKDSNDTMISHTSELEGIIVDNPNNLFVNNIKIFLGYELGAFTKETLILYTNDNLTYYPREDAKKNIYLRWIHKIDDKTYQLLNYADVVADDRYDLRWFKYSPGYPIIDQYAGKDWELIQEEMFNYELFPDGGKQTEQLKVVGLIKDLEITDNDLATPYFSNVLIFENEKIVPDQTTLEAANALSIYCEDNTEGNYFLYNQNGKITNEGQGKGHYRRLKPMFQGAEITSDLGNIDWIKWYFPLNENTMIVSTDDMLKQDNGIVNKNISYYGIDYVEILREDNPLLYQEYSIDSFWNYQKSNNTVICHLSLDGVEYQAIKELHFGKAGSNGTNMTFLIDFLGNENAINFDLDNSDIIVQAKLYCDGQEQSLGFSSVMAENIEWKWYQPIANDIEIIKNLDNISAKLVLKNEKASYDFSQNFHILQAIYSIGTQKLEAFLPIPYKRNNCAYIEGAREVIYNAQGNPQYYNDAYVPYQYNRETGKYDEIKINNQPILWDVKYNEYQSENISYMAVLKDHPGRKGYKALSAGTFYIPSQCDAVCVSSDYWSQPILIMQSKYDFAMLNEWDGTFKLDEENGVILSTMLSAGRKNDNNTYSGVLIGDVRTGVGNDSIDTLTGIYGLSEGQISYALKEDGSAVFGKKGKGQIQINGNVGVIKSSNYTSTIDSNGNVIEGAVGLELNLTEGTFVARDKNGRDKIVLSSLDDTNPDMAYLKVYGKDSLNSSGAYEKHELIHIDDDRYFLHSATFKVNNNKKIEKGMAIDLANGYINIVSDDSSSQSSFLIKNELGTSLISIGSEGYFLQSSAFIGQRQKTKTKNNIVYYLYNNPANFPLNANNSIPKGDCYRAGSEYYLEKNNNFSKIVFEKYAQVYEDENNNKYEEEQEAEYRKRLFASQLTAVTETTEPKGMKINLDSGTIEGYELYLAGTHKLNGKENKLLIDTSNDKTPFSIGDNFSVDWDGSVSCNKITTLQAVDNPIYNIQLGEHFYITQGGSGGGNWAGSIYGRSYTPTTITSNGETYTILQQK